MSEVDVVLSLELAAHFREMSSQSFVQMTTVTCTESSYQHYTNGLDTYISGFALGFQHFLRDLANVNEWKIMIDPLYWSMLFNF